MKTSFGKDTLGEAFVLAIKQDYDFDVIGSDQFKDACGDVVVSNILPFKGIEQVNQNLADNPQYMNIPVHHLYTASACFNFPIDLNWRKYAPRDFPFRNSDKQGHDFEDTILGSILPDDDPLIAVKARNKIYVLDGEEDDYWISSFKIIDFKPAEFSGLLDEKNQD